MSKRYSISKRCGTEHLSLDKRIKLAGTIKEVKSLLKEGKNYDASDTKQLRWQKSSEKRMAEIRG
jgi:hypothetical protein